jgi:Domain of unknown function (DUF4129)
MTADAGRLAVRRRWLVYCSYAIACGMVASFGAIFTLFLSWLFPALDSRGIVWACAVAVLEAFFSFWLVARLPTAQRQIAFYRSTEIVLLLVAVKFFAELRADPASFWNNVLLWPVQFPFNIINLNFIFTALPVLAAWWSGNLFAGDLSLLEMEDASFLDERLSKTPLRTVILRRFLSLGVLVVLLAGIPAQNVFTIPIRAAPAASALVIAYFILGILLLSLTRYITLETGWSRARLPVPAQIPRRWFAYSVAILAALVLLAGLLPTSYGLGLFDTLSAVYDLIVRFFLVLYAIILLVFSLVARLFFREDPNSQTPLPKLTLPPEEPSAAASVINWALVRSIILWGALIVLGFVAIRQYIAYNRDLFEELRRFRPLAWLFSAGERLKASFKKANTAVGAFIQNSLKRLRRPGPEPVRLGAWYFINPLRLPARQKVIFYYLALVRRAREAGLPRQQNQTPYEYAHALASSLAEEKDDLDGLTESFIEARYSQHDIPSRAARRAESIWETIRRVLKSVKNTRREDRMEDPDDPLS